LKSPAVRTLAPWPPVEVVMGAEKFPEEFVGVQVRPGFAGFLCGWRRGLRLR